MNKFLKCNKKAFNSIDEARLRLTEIVIDSNREIKPIRVYKCEFCKKYHLTSKSEKIYNHNLDLKIKKIQKINQKREASFIRRESEYWNKRFGIEY